MLPWMLFVLLFTIVSSPAIAYFFLTRTFAITEAKQITTESNLSSAVGNQLQKTDQALEVFKFEKRTLLDRALIEQRYRQAGLSQTSRLWTRYLAFFTGMSLCLIGSFFVLGRLSDDTPTTIDAEKLLRLKVASASPGLIIIVLGTLIIVVGLLKQDQLIDVNDGAQFVEVPYQNTHVKQLPSVNPADPPAILGGSSK
jgi:hypothetical protein